MKIKVLLVEDREGQQKMLANEIENVSPSVELMPVCDSLQDVIEQVINKQLLPNYAIIDGNIFKEAEGSRAASARPEIRSGIEVIERLLAAGMESKVILMLTAFKPTVEIELKKLNLERPVRVIEKPIHPTKLRDILTEALPTL